MKKVLSIIMAMVMAVSFFSVGMGVYAEDLDTPADEEISVRYTHISSHSESLTISGLTAKCNARLNGKTSMSLKIKMELQKKSSGTYSTTKTWSSSKTGTVIALSGSKTINPLSTYRLKITYTAGSETITVYAYS